MKLRLLSFRPKGKHYIQATRELQGQHYDILLKKQLLAEATEKDPIELKDANLKKAQKKADDKIEKTLNKLNDPKSKLSKFFSKTLSFSETGEAITPLSILNHCEHRDIKTSYPLIAKLIEEIQGDLKDSNPKETAKQYQKAIQFMLKNKILNLKNNGKALEAKHGHGVSYPVERRDDCWSIWKNLIHYEITRTELGTKILQQQTAKQTI